MAVAFAHNRPGSDVRQGEFGRAAGGFSGHETAPRRRHRALVSVARAEGEKRVDSPPPRLFKMVGKNVSVGVIPSWWAGDVWLGLLMPFARTNSKSVWMRPL